MNMNGLSGVGQSKGMQHSEAMYKSHHNKPVQDNVVVENKDRFEKSRETGQLKLYNEKGEIIK